MEMARVGDHLVLESERVGAPGREGEVLEVLGQGDALHYFVRWEDGRKSYLYPGSGSATFHRRELPKRSR